MFNNPIRPTNDVEEATVTEVDLNGKLCKVKTSSGKNLKGISFIYPMGGANRGGIRGTPTLGDRVLIDSRLGFPCIAAYLPRLQGVDNTFPIAIDTGEELVETGSFSPAGGEVILDMNSPSDAVVGDQLISSVGGGVIAMLRGGSILLRSSRLAEIFISKWDDVVRVTARNFELFTDLSSETIKNMGGSLYRYAGYAQKFADTKIENYLFNQYWGNVVQGLSSQANYINDTALAPDDRIYKEQIVDAAGGNELMYREIHLTGEVDVKVSTPGGTTSQIKQTNNSTLITTTTGGGQPFTKMYQTPAQVTVSFNDTNIVTINTSEIQMSFGGNPTLTMDANGIRAIFGGAEINMSSSGIACTYSGHFMNVTSSGVQTG